MAGPGYDGAKTDYKSVAALADTNDYEWSHLQLEICFASPQTGRSLRGHWRFRKAIFCRSLEPVFQ